VNDNDAFSHLPAAREFRDAVVERDPNYVEACFHTTDPRTLAVWCAELWDDARFDAEGLRAELESERGDLARSRAECAVLRSRVESLLGEVRELRGLASLDVNRRLFREREALRERVRNLERLLAVGASRAA